MKKYLNTDGPRLLTRAGEMAIFDALTASHPNELQRKIQRTACDMVCELVNGTPVTDIVEQLDRSKIIEALSILEKS
ncbi:MAG: hypothetical protein IKO20_03995 [Bacteroidaceae bacterium]|nr:hypothetical protein [Bacteroidaceae bacterium]